MTPSRSKLIQRPISRPARRNRLRRRPTLGSALLLSGIGALALLFLLTVGIADALWRRHIG